jgi:hypothetical protein
MSIYEIEKTVVPDCYYDKKIKLFGVAIFRKYRDQKIKEVYLIGVKIYSRINELPIDLLNKMEDRVSDLEGLIAGLAVNLREIKRFEEEFRKKVEESRDCG